MARVSLERLGPNHYRATNERGITIELGDAESGAFTPVELLLVAIAGCSAVDVDLLTSRRAEPETFTVTSSGTKVSDAERGNHLEDVEVVFDVTFPSGDAGDAARDMLPVAITKSHERLCTVSRTVELPTPVAMR